MANWFRAQVGANKDSLETRHATAPQGHNTKGRCHVKQSRLKKFAPLVLALGIVVMFALAFSGTANADARQDCINACRGGPKDALAACIGLCPAAGGGSGGGTAGGGHGGGTGTAGHGGGTTGGGCGDKIAIKQQCADSCDENQLYDYDESGKLVCKDCTGDACESATTQFKLLERQIKELKEQVAAIKPTCPALTAPAPLAWYAGFGWLPWVIIFLLLIVILALVARKSDPPKSKKPPQGGGQPPTGGGNQFGAAP